MKKGKLEHDLGNENQGQANKNGKGGYKIKDGEMASSATMATKITEPQRSQGQERKGNSLGKEGDSSTRVGRDLNKGKEIMHEDKALGKGILGSGPTQIDCVTSVSQPKQASNKASTSAQAAASSSDRPNQAEPLIAGPGPISERRPLLINQPPVQLVVGPKGNKMQIVAVPSSPKKKQQPDSSSPSAAERTKSNRNSRLHSKKDSTPVKFQASKALQIWSPVKDKKNKSRTRLATLTFQEINAWTGAAVQADRS
ncbi:unnamed protein product [Linum trigynum]|uniref:Uncharacterized protein n=1 Tax=Linum trigynum TaxID=586398 RepID=A0AAV2DVF3_9ROSI